MFEITLFIYIIQKKQSNLNNWEEFQTENNIIKKIEKKKVCKKNILFL